MGSGTGAEWEAVYLRHLDLRDKDLFPDTISNCGVPAGFPRQFNLPDLYEFVVRPEQVWVLTENGPNVMRIYTEWSLEWGSPNSLGRQGIRPTTFPPGAKATMRLRPMLNGAPAGAFVGAKFTDGKTAGRWEE